MRRSHVDVVAGCQRGGDRIADERAFDAIAVNPSLSKTDFSR
jgi:hypothetical protein